MKTKTKKHIIRALVLSLCLCLLCLPLMGMAMNDTAGNEPDSGEPEIVVIDIVPEEESGEVALLSWNHGRPGGGGGRPDDPCDPNPPQVCNCEVKCQEDEPDPDCPVCSADIEVCTGVEPTPASLWHLFSQLQTGAGVGSMPVQSSMSAEQTGQSGSGSFS